MSKQLTVVLDLDHTIIYSCHPMDSKYFDTSRLHTFVTPGNYINPDGVFVILRPGLLEFLHDLHDFCDLMIFTASSKEYAQPIVKMIDPEGILFRKIFFREHTTFTTRYSYTKNLELINKPLEKVLILDDEPDAFYLQPRNGIFVTKFKGDPNDNCLISTYLPLIRILSEKDDVRDFTNCRTS